MTSSSPGAACDLKIGESLVAHKRLPGSDPKIGESAVIQKRAHVSGEPMVEVP